MGARMAKLMTLQQTAEALGVPSGSLKSAAEGHGFLVRVGRAIRMDPDDFPAFIAACKEKPVRAASGAYRAPSADGTSTESIQRVIKATKALRERSKARRRTYQER